MRKKNGARTTWCAASESVTCAKLAPSGIRTRCAGPMAAPPQPSHQTVSPPSASAQKRRGNVSSFLRLRRRRRLATVAPVEEGLQDQHSGGGIHPRLVLAGGAAQPERADGLLG